MKIGITKLESLISVVLPGLNPLMANKNLSTGILIFRVVV